MSETWDEITGSKEKPTKSLVMPKALVYKHETEEQTARRRGQALEAIFKTFKDPTYNHDGMLTAEKNGFKFDFWPASDCWFSYSKQRYGSGIEELCQTFEKYLAQKGEQG